MQFVDGDGNIIVPKSVRPIIDLKQTMLGSKNGAQRQFRYGKLHIREYDSHYTVHMDKVDPLRNPLGHLFVDAPEYVAAAAAALIVAKRVGSAMYDKRKREGKHPKEAAIDAAVAAYLAGSSAGKIIYNAANDMKKKRREK